jgi:hypothetical protein
MQGGGKSTNTGTNTSAETNSLMQVFKMAKPTMQALSSQTAEALQTGGVNARIPSVSASVAAAREAYSTSQQSLKNQLSQSGLANSSFGQEILGQSSMNAGQQIGALPTTLTNDFLARGVPAVAGMGTNALSTAAQLNRTGTLTPSFWDQFQQMLKIGLDPGGVFGTGGFSMGGGGGGGKSGSTSGLTSYAGDTLGSTGA